MDEYSRLGSASGSEFESTVGELIDKARRMLAAQERMRRLLRANQVVFEGLELERVLRHIAEAAVTASDARYGALWLVDEDRRIDWFLPIDMPEQIVARFSRSLEGKAALETVAASHVPIALDGIGPPESATSPLDDRSGFGGFLGVPLRAGGDAYGALFLASRGPQSFSDEDEELLEALASTAAIAIGNAQQFEEARRTQRLAAILGDVAAALLSSESSSPYGIVAERARSLTSADLTAIVVRMPGGRLEIVTARGVQAETLENTTVDGDVSLIESALAGEDAISGEKGPRAPSFGPRLQDGSTIAVPFMVPGCPDAALCATRAGDRDPFAIPDRATLSEFATQAAVAVTMSRDRAERQQLDLTEERARIARDLHDHVIQRLYSVGLSLQAVATKDSDISAAIEMQIDDIDAAIADIRTAIFALHTPGPHFARHRILDTVTGLTPQLGAAPRLTFSGPIDLIVVGDLADDVVAVVRESLANVVRHAQARSTRVSVSATERDLAVTVDDDGIGPPAHRPRASGTANLAARAQSRGGVFALERRPSGGSRASWRIPIQSVEVGND